MELKNGLTRIQRCVKSVQQFSTATSMFDWMSLSLFTNSLTTVVPLTSEFEAIEKAATTLKVSGLTNIQASLLALLDVIKKDLTKFGSSAPSIYLTILTDADDNMDPKIFPDAWHDLQRYVKDQHKGFLYGTAIFVLSNSSTANAAQVLECFEKILRVDDSDFSQKMEVVENSQRFFADMGKTQTKIEAEIVTEVKPLIAGIQEKVKGIEQMVANVSNDVKKTSTSLIKDRIKNFEVQTMSSLKGQLAKAKDSNNQQKLESVCQQVKEEKKNVQKN